MKILSTYFFLFCISLSLYQARAQVYRNCNATFTAIRKDSVTVTAKTDQAMVELNIQSGEIIFMLKAGSLSSNDAVLNNELKQRSEKIYFRGFLGEDPTHLVTDKSSNQTLPLTGYVKLNKIQHGVVAHYSVFLKSNSSGNPQGPLLTLEFYIKLSDFRINQYFPELDDEVKVTLVRQPLNIIIE
jgi:hypothetical protein